MREKLIMKIEELDRNIEYFKQELLPKYRKEAYINNVFSTEYFGNKMKILTNLNEKRNIYFKRLDKLNKLISIEHSIGYVKDAIQLNQKICFVSYSTKEESIRFMLVKYNNILDSEVIEEKTLEDKDSIEIMLNTPFTRFICFDKRSLFELLNKKNVYYNKDLFSDIQRMALFFYGDLDNIKKLDKLYEDIPIYKEDGDNSLRKIKNIFEGIIYS